MSEESRFQSESLCKCSALKNKRRYGQLQSTKAPSASVQQPKFSCPSFKARLNLPPLQEPEVSLPRMPKGN